MTANKDSFTDLAQLDKLNQKALKIFARDRDIDQDTKSEVKDTAPPLRSSVPGDDAEPNAIDTPPPKA